ncbi:hypothetical protein B296_00009607 [Ensete ventricosum]|uniref:Uncharacterized protein n=1 Tax=Ensete ventricosum TaxID=4639 RepID=A0A427BAI1_ENSVE|nr:hypothetical protein B296_00009607 [Ensete ventricosum]
MYPRASCITKTISNLSNGDDSASWKATGPDGRGGGKRSVGLRESEEGIGGVLTGRGGAEAENVHRRRKEGVRWPVILREEGIKGVSFDNEVGGLASEVGEGRKRRGRTR